MRFEVPGGLEREVEGLGFPMLLREGLGVNNGFRGIYKSFSKRQLNASKGSKGLAKYQQETTKPHNAQTPVSGIKENSKQNL